MLAMLLGSVLSLLFFSAVLAAEIRGGDTKRVRELGIIVCILALVAAYAGHGLITGGPQVASIASLLLGG
jgi:predicted nucleic acid-binding protein